MGSVLLILNSSVKIRKVVFFSFSFECLVVNKIERQRIHKVIKRFQPQDDLVGNQKALLTWVAGHWVVGDGGSSAV